MSDPISLCPCYRLNLLLAPQPPRTHTEDPHDRGTHTCHQKPLRNLRVHPGLWARSERVSNSNFTDSCTASQDTRMQGRNEALREMSLQLESLQQFCARVQQTHFRQGLRICAASMHPASEPEMTSSEDSWRAERRTSRVRSRKVPRKVGTQNHGCKKVDLVCVNRAETYTWESNT